MTAEFLTAAEAATRFDRSLSTIYRWLAKGRLSGVKIGRRWLIKSLNTAIRAVAKTVEAVRARPAGAGLSTTNPCPG